MANRFSTIAEWTIVVLFLFAQTALAIPFLADPADPDPSGTPMALRDSPRTGNPSRLPPSLEARPGLVVVDFRVPCDTMYVLTLKGPLDRPLDSAGLLAAVRQGTVSTELDATLELRGGMLMMVTLDGAVLPPTSEDGRAAWSTVFPGGHFDYLLHGEGSVLAGTVRPLGHAAEDRSHWVETSSATLVSGDGTWFPLEARFLVSAYATCD